MIVSSELNIRCFNAAAMCKITRNASAMAACECNVQASERVGSDSVNGAGIVSVSKRTSAWPSAQTIKGPEMSIAINNTNMT